MADTKSNTFKTPIARLSYTYLFTPRLSKKSKPGDKAKFSTTALFLPKDKMSDQDRAFYDALMKGCLELAIEKIGRDKVAAMVKDGKQFLPFRKDIATQGFPEEFHDYIRPWSYQQPGIVSTFRDPQNGKPMAINDPKLVYSGIWARLTVAPFYFEAEGNKGIGLGLRNLQKVKDGDRLDGRTNAEDEFEATEDATADDMAALAGTGGNAASPPPENGKDELAALLGG